MIEISKKYMPTKVIFDLRETPYEDFFSFAREKNIKTIVFDTLGNVSGQPDIIINDSFVSRFTSYSCDRESTIVHTGPQYFLSDKLPKPLPLKRNISNIAITMGGSDPAGLTEKIVRSLSFLETTKKYNIILGPLFCEHVEEIIRNFCHNQPQYEIYRNPSNFLEILSKQDLIMCSAGRTLYECAYLGRPTIVIPSIEHEYVTAENYSRLTGCVNVGIWNKNTGHKILEAMREYENLEFREEMSQLSRQLVDGKAQSRIMEIIN